MGWEGLVTLLLKDDSQSQYWQSQLKARSGGRERPRMYFFFFPFLRIERPLPKTVPYTNVDLGERLCIFFFLFFFHSVILLSLSLFNKGWIICSKPDNWDKLGLVGQSDDIT